jgi:AAA domain
VSGPQVPPGSPEELHARMLRQAAWHLIEHGREAVAENIRNRLVQDERWQPAAAADYAARIAAEAGTWTADQAAGHFRAFQANGSHAVDEVEITTRQRKVHADREAHRREDRREAEAAQAVVTPASEITKKRARWLWRSVPGGPEIPLGEVTVGAGREGVAKTQFTYWLIAQVTRGTLPGELKGKPRSVIICAREDDWEKTIVPRLEAAGADLGKVFRVEAVRVASGRSVHLSLPADNGLLGKEITRLDAALVIFDPLLSALDSQINSNRAADVRSALEPLAGIAHGTGCSMIGLAHFAKMEGRDAASLISGSHAFKDVARAIIVFARDSEDTGVMSQPKNNLGRQPSLSLEYSVEPVEIDVSDGTADVSRFVMGEPTARSVEDLLDTGITRAVATAKDFLRSELNEGEKSAKDIAAGARAHQIAERTLARARKELRITPSKHEDGTWWLALPGSDGSVGDVGSVGSVGILPSSQPVLPSQSRMPTLPPFPRAREIDWDEIDRIAWEGWKERGEDT